MFRRVKVVQNALVALNVLLVIGGGWFVVTCTQGISGSAAQLVRASMTDGGGAFIIAGVILSETPWFLAGLFAFAAGWIGLCLMARRPA